MEATLIDNGFEEHYSSSVISFNIRLSYYISKMNIGFHTIEKHLLEPRITDLDVNVLVREKCMAAEFERRFSRVNLYSIQLKLKKLEREISTFRSTDCCRIAQSFILRNLVLSLFKYLNHALQVYLKFFQKVKIKAYLKLKELLNYVCHTGDMISYIVDQNYLNVHGFIRQSCSLLKILEILNETEVVNSRSKNNTVTVMKHGVVRMPTKTKTKNLKVIKRNLLTANSRTAIGKVNEVIQNEISVGNLIKKQRKVRFNICDCEDNRQVQATFKRPGSFRNRLSETTSKLCEAILNNLVAEMVADIASGIREIVLDTFDREFIFAND